MAALLALPLAACSLSGCGSPDPQQQEASKYPQAKPLSQEQLKAIDDKMAAMRKPGFTEGARQMPPGAAKTRMTGEAPKS